MTSRKREERYDDLNPDEYRADLIAMGAGDEDADAAAAELRDRQGGGR